MHTFSQAATYIREKLSHPGVRKHSKNIGWLLVAKIVGIVVTFFATAIVARNLGPKNYGELSYAISFMSIFSFFASLGVEQILSRDLVKYPEQRNVYLGTSISLRLFGSTVSILSCLLGLFFLSVKDLSFILILIVSFSPLLSSFQLLVYEFQADFKSKYIAFFTITITTLMNLLKILVTSFDRGVIYLAVLVLVEAILYSIGYSYLKIKVYKDLQKIRFDTKIAYSILRDSFPLIFVSAFYIIYARIDQVMIKNMIDTKSVGLYDAAVRISEVSYFIPNILITSFFTSIVNAKKVDDSLYFRRLKRLLLLLTSISTVVAIITCLFSRELILLVFGKDFIEALPVLTIYIWSNIGAALNLLTQQMLLAENFTKTTSVTIFLGMVINVALNVILIPQYGMQGAAFASLISYMVPFLSLLLFKKTRTLLISVLRA